VNSDNRRNLIRVTVLAGRLQLSLHNIVTAGQVQAYNEDNARNKRRRLNEIKNKEDSAGTGKYIYEEQHR
jgi:hypothetical protein